MRIGIDCRKIGDFGIGRYIRGVLHALVDLAERGRVEPLVAEQSAAIEEFRNHVVGRVGIDRQARNHGNRGVLTRQAHVHGHSQDGAVDIQPQIGKIPQTSRKRFIQPQLRLGVEISESVILYGHASRCR